MHQQPAELPRLPEGGWLEESPARLALIRGVALLAVLVTTAYLAWRASSTVALDVWWIALPMLAVEIHNAFGLCLYTFALWDVGRRPNWRRVASTRMRVAVLIPTVNESVEVLTPTILAALALRPAHQTWVLDDGARPEVRELALGLGARYLARPDRTHAKAGNLNHALETVQADVIAVLDADHVPTRDFLAHTLGYFDDPRVAIVQTPQSFYNTESFEHEPRGNDYFNEESVFYRVIAPAKNRWSAPFWCGTGALVRVEALRSIGGVATESVTEDIHSTIRMYRAGWTGVFHNEILAHGLAPADAASYLGQRRRWATGAMQVLRLENPLFGPGLTLGQRTAFMATLFAWFDSWRMLAYLVLPVAVIATGASPIAAPGHIFLPIFLLTLGLQFVALRLLARGHYPPFLSMLFEVLRMPAVLPATLIVFRRDVSRPFWVTPKGRAQRRGGQVPLLLRIAAIASTASLGWVVLVALEIVSVRYPEPGAVIGAGIFVALNLALLTAAISRIRAARFAGERRASVRFDVRLPGRLSSRRCIVLDVSLTGAQVVVPAGRTRLARRPTLRLEVDGHVVRVQCSVRRVQPQSDGATMVGLEFDASQPEPIRRLALLLFRADGANAEHGAQAAGRVVRRVPAARVAV